MGLFGLLFRTLPATFLVIVALVAMPRPALAEDKGAVKAALVYNVLRFATFPGDTSQLRVCASVSDPIAGDLRKLDGRTIGGSRLNVVLVAGPSGFGPSCNVIYLDDDSPRSVGGVSRGQILIGSARNFAENGGSVGLITFGGQVRFVINTASAKRSGVTFSSQLLQLAAKVISQ